MKHKTPRRGQKEYQMSVFTVNLKNQPGELARLCEAMADRGINLVPSATARGEQGTVVFIAHDEASAETVLQEADIGYTMRPALTIRMENQPDAGAATFRKLARAGVNADLLLPVRVSNDLFFAVICVDDAGKARRALGAQVIREGGGFRLTGPPTGIPSSPLGQLATDVIVPPPHGEPRTQSPSCPARSSSTTPAPPSSSHRRDRA
jgi:hypothetical protein